ncbi:hypothetical protein TNCV_3425161 [Trichonephila clavipes]|nr:hypothetical protein TNCV_3425161 [Trichonephila clavipes]
METVAKQHYVIHWPSPSLGLQSYIIITHLVERPLSIKSVCLDLKDYKSLAFFVTGLHLSPGLQECLRRHRLLALNKRIMILSIQERPIHPIPVQQLDESEMWSLQG